MQQIQVMIIKRSHTMENLYKSLKESWKCFRLSLVSIESSISSVGAICCHPCGVTTMGPEEVPAVSASSTFGCFCRVSTTSPAEISRASGRSVLAGRGGMIRSPVDILGASSFVPDLSSLAGSALEMSLSASALDNAGVSLSNDD
jgi:hypothetical protein